MPPRRHTNKLIHESSPYLLQHAHNPVDWHPWNAETLAKARSVDKMLLVSIGYSACHWCHVMEKESFMDEKVAEIMNRHYLCVKVDREERPDVDQVYMTAVQLITGSGGWPLNCFALPDGRPFFGGTYFRKDQWIQLLENIHLLFQTRKEDLIKQAGDLTRGIAAHDMIVSSLSESSIKKDDILRAKARLKDRLDSEHGGLAGAPKFPMPSVLNFLLQEHYFSRDGQTEAFLRTTLRKMAFGGICDQVGGGFARYSTDALWKVPHFEKMLYDNALLVQVYCKSFRTWKDPVDKEVIIDTLDFVRREMTLPDGGFCSSLDADSEGEEGRFYTWTQGEFRQILGGHADLLARYYQVGEKALWESGRNILQRSGAVEEFVQGTGLQPSQFRAMLKTARARLLKARNKRPRPALDDKTLTSWNAMMIKGFLDAYNLLGRREYLDTALKNAHFLMNSVTESDGRLSHAWKNGKASVNGFLEDYSFLADALLELYQATFDRKYLDLALRLATYAIEHFYDRESGLFFVTSSLDPPLIARKYEIYDNVIPSSNAVMAEVLHRLGLAFDREDLMSISLQMLMNLRDKALLHPAAFSHWLTGMTGQVYPFFTVAVLGPDALKIAHEIRKTGYPCIFFCGSDKEEDLPALKDRFAEGKTMIFVCTGRECKLPTESPEAAINHLKETRV